MHDDRRIRIREAKKHVDPDPEHCLEAAGGAEAVDEDPQRLQQEVTEAQTRENLQPQLGQCPAHSLGQCFEDGILERNF